MIKVITYGTFDKLHIGHIRLLERAKALGDYLIVGVTSEDFDKSRGKINLAQSLTERIESVRGTGLADMIVVEEYEGQKIDDIRRYGVDVFTVGSDWEGQFDYLEEYCKVVYLPRTEGISSSEVRAEERRLRIGLIGSDEGRILNKYCAEAKYVNGATVSAICTRDRDVRMSHGDVPVVDSYDDLLSTSDAVYILSHPTQHYDHIRQAIERGRHVLVEMPVVLDTRQHDELFRLAEANDVVLMPAMKTAYATAYNRLLLLLKSGKIGKVVSVDATCTSIRDIPDGPEGFADVWNSVCAWGPTALLPVFQVLGTEYRQMNMASLYLDRSRLFDSFTKIDFLYDSAVASVKVARGVKSEGDLVVSGTEGYVYVPSPWWKTDYFEVRYEHQERNRRYFYQLDGEGIRYELVAFIKAVRSGKAYDYVPREVARQVTKVIERFYGGESAEIR